jgi:hypothetical protein
MDKSIVSHNIIHCKIKVTKPPSIKRQHRIVKRIKQLKRSIELENRLTQNNIKNEIN